MQLEARPARQPCLVSCVHLKQFSMPNQQPRGRRDGSLRPHFRFSRQEPLLFYQVAPQLYSRGRVDPVPDPLLFSSSPPPPRKSGSGRNRTWASGSVAKNSDH
jgi:hypothetical protein